MVIKLDKLRNVLVKMWNKLNEKVNVLDKLD